MVTDRATLPHSLDTPRRPMGGNTDQDEALPSIKVIHCTPSVSLVQVPVARLIVPHLGQVGLLQVNAQIVGKLQEIGQAIGQLGL